MGLEGAWADWFWPWAWWVLGFGVGILGVWFWGLGWDRLGLRVGEFGFWDSVDYVMACGVKFRGLAGCLGFGRTDFVV